MRAFHLLATAGLGIVLAGSSLLAGNAAGPGAALFRSGALPQKGGQQVPLDQLPAAVTAAILKAYPNSTIVAAMKGGRGAQVRYELSVKTSPDAPPISVMASPDGLIRAGGRNAVTPGGMPAAAKGQRKAQAAASTPQRQMIEVRDLPKAVVNAIKDAYPKDTIIDAVKISVGPPVLYQVGLNDVSSLMPLRVVISADGKFQKR